MRLEPPLEGGARAGSEERFTEPNKLDGLELRMLDGRESVLINGEDSRFVDAKDRREEIDGSMRGV